MWIDPKMLPEILEAVEKVEKYFAVVELERAGVKERFRFGVNSWAYSDLRKIFQLHPFDQTPGFVHRYFFYPTVGLLNDERTSMAVRVMQGSNAKNIEVEVDLALAANLMWFYELDDFKKAEKLIFK